jgi:hypothetical protein
MVHQCKRVLGWTETLIIVPTTTSRFKKIQNKSKDSDDEDDKRSGMTGMTRATTASHRNANLTLLDERFEKVSSHSGKDGRHSP